MSITVQIGQRIQAVRESKGLNLEDLANRCKDSGSPVSKSFIWKLENKNCDVGLSCLDALARALEIFLPDLVNENLSIEYITSDAALESFCQEDKISGEEKTYLKGLLDKGIFFSTAKDWRAHHRARESNPTYRSKVTELHGRVADASENYQVRRKPRATRRKRPQ